MTIRNNQWPVTNLGANPGHFCEEAYYMSAHQPKDRPLQQSIGKFFTSPIQPIDCSIRKGECVASNFLEFRAMQT
jgi:hypothetical protein